MLEDLNCDNIKEIILKHELSQAPFSPRISIYEVFGKTAKVFVDKQFLGGKGRVAKSLFFLKDIDRDSYKEILFFQPYWQTENTETEGLIIYKWDGKEYHSLSKFTILYLLLLYQSYSSLFMFLVFLFLFCIVIFFVILGVRERFVRKYIGDRLVKFFNIS